MLCFSRNVLSSEFRMQSLKAVFFYCQNSVQIDRTKICYAKIRISICLSHFNCNVFYSGENNKFALKTNGKKTIVDNKFSTRELKILIYRLILVYFRSVSALNVHSIEGKQNIPGWNGWQLELIPICYKPIRKQVVHVKWLKCAVKWLRILKSSILHRRPVHTHTQGKKRNYNQIERVGWLSNHKIRSPIQRRCVCVNRCRTKCMEI